MKVLRGFCAVLVWTACLIALPAAAGEHEPKMDRAAVEQIVRDYLMRNPEIILEAMRELEKRQKVAEAARQRDAIAANRVALLEAPGSPAVGAADADVTIVEFFDYKCTYCKRTLAPLMTVVKGDAKVRVVFKEFPILGEESMIAARAAVASISQGKYLVFHEALMSARGSLSEANVMAIAEDIGLDTGRLKRDMTEPEVDAEIRANYALATKLGIKGTPAFVVGCKLAPGAVTEAALVQLVRTARETAQAC